VNFSAPQPPQNLPFSRSDVPTKSEIRKIAFLGDYLPRKCGIATFTSDLLAAVAAEHPQCECFAVPVNDRKGGYEYPDVVRFEVEEQDLSSYQRAADVANLGAADIAWHEIIEGKMGFQMPEFVALTRPTGKNRKRPQHWAKSPAGGDVAGRFSK
jgi:hypothetical protein